ncbi:class I SAM-dependent DNA methyltransferase [Kordiimonas lacus]|uniref:site-specific DNA-methyltransferase (adenine-specific) n=1 Tax=Kordiimonas lacus TaxID=637679 RepID=A0A1G7DLH5_9PROT|nr:DNA methyltransferase [Kordiimonas lacus]SDE52358.1 Type II restriction/modification system, DNA methylase subunit YeeA [Kordiimonas lacus]
MTDTHPTDAAIEAFIGKWKGSEGGELAESQQFLLELCDLLAVPRPFSQAEDAEGTYRFERTITFHHEDDTISRGRIDLYKKDCFVLESKQGTLRREKEELERQKQLGSRTVRSKRIGTAVRGTDGWDRAMLKARTQAESYAKALPAEDGWPPFLMVVDVGHEIHLYSDFAQAGKNYSRYPDSRSYRITIDDLRKEEKREILRQIWLDPRQLDPSRKSAKVTREIADHLAKLAKSLEGKGHSADAVAGFLMRCLFTMFAEDIKLLPERSFTELLESMRGDTRGLLPRMLEALWGSMDRGGFSPELRETVKRFNGYLFKERTALPLEEPQLELLILAARADWKSVEPAIFGTLLERALDPRERHKLGAHYTPRAYVERLVVPTVMEPLKQDWQDVQTAIETHLERGDRDAARDEVRRFHHKLCTTRVLDPACGSGNFLYVALEHMKQLEGEVIDRLERLGGQRGLELAGETVDPHQFLGIELNPRAARIAETVLWIGYLQWHYRTHGTATPAEPVLKDFHNIENRDAVLDWDDRQLVRDDHGVPITVWDRQTTKTHPSTGKEVPDETAQMPVYTYVKPRAAVWPEAEFIIGNPPYIAGKDMRAEFGDGYATALWKSYKVNKSADYVMYWWHKAGLSVQKGTARRLGFITTNSITQTFSRRTVEEFLAAKKPLSLIYAIPNHPWVDGKFAAAVRVAFTVACAGNREGRLIHMIKEPGAEGEGVETPVAPKVGKIWANLKQGANVSAVVGLRANSLVSTAGYKLHGAGFLLSAADKKRFPSHSQCLIFDFINGKDMTGASRNKKIIDAFGFTDEELRREHPEIYQHLYEHVKPERDANRDKAIRENWWLFGRNRQELRAAKEGLPRYIATVETAKHRVFKFLDASVAPDNMLVCMALDDGYHLGILSSQIHVVWALAAGGRLGVGNDPRYNKSKCFDPFPFPETDDAHKKVIRDLADELDTHRKARQEEHPKLTLTEMYNVLEKLRAGEALNDKEKSIHDRGLVSILKDLHDKLDAAVADAYGWPHTLTDDEILERLVALNKERAREEANGVVRWLRPDFQNPEGTRAATQGKLDVGVAETVAAVGKRPWPSSLPEQAQAVREVLEDGGTPKDVATVYAAFKGAKGRVDKVAELLETLVAVGHARITPDGHFAANR